MEVEPTVPREMKSVASDTSRVASLRKTRIRPGPADAFNFQLFCLGLITPGVQPHRRSFVENQLFEKHLLGIVHGFLADFTHKLVAGVFARARFVPNAYQGALARLVCDGYDMIDSAFTFIKVPRIGCGTTTLLQQLSVALITARPSVKMLCLTDSVGYAEWLRKIWDAYRVYRWDTLSVAVLPYNPSIAGFENFDVVLLDTDATRAIVEQERDRILRTLSPSAVLLWCEAPQDAEGDQMMLAQIDPEGAAPRTWTGVKKLTEASD